LNRLFKRAQRLHKALIADEKPKPDAEPWECKFCEFKGECVEMRGEHDYNGYGKH
jgi:CRISPR/Cas system-associated exonuclease Cas4 (RecB family)